MDPDLRSAAPPRITYQQVAGSLQPLSYTEPAPAPEREPAPTGPRPPRRRLWIVAAVVAAVSFGGAAAWKILRPDHRARLNHARLVIVSGRASPKREPNGAEERWQKNHVTVTIDDSIDALGPAAREAVQSAFGTWLTSGAHVPDLTFDSAHGTRVSEKPDGKNSVVFAPIDIPGHRNDLALTLAFTDPDTGAILEADLVINSHHHFGLLDTAAPGSGQHLQSNEHENDAEGAKSTCSAPQVVKCDGRYDLQSVATHEVGHFLGLGEDGTDRCATMYRSTGRCQVNKRLLSSDDRTSMTELYTAPFTDNAAANSASCSIARSPERGESVPFGAALGALFAIGAALRRRRR